AALQQAAGRPFLDLMREVRFSDCYAFAYSERNVTRAAGWPDQVPVPARKERLARLLALQKEISLADNRARIGGIADVLVEGRSRTDPRKLTGRTGHNKVVNFAGDPGMAGSIVPVRILEAFPNSLGGEPA
ncbi:MAG: TRAM domain-containing protein, partial [Myxococcota bacterium]